MQLGYYKINDGISDLEFATDQSACFDLRIDLDHNEIKGFNKDSEKVALPVTENVDVGKIVRIPPSSVRWMLPTGLIFDIPLGYHMAVNVRGGTGLKRGLILANSTGIVDSDYVEETFLLIQNVSGDEITLVNGERICQAHLVQNVETELVKINERPKQKTQRAGGFNSSGKLDNTYKMNKPC